MQLILASQSPRRQELLRLITPDFTVCPADVNEELIEGASLCDEVARLAAAKAEAVYRSHPQAAVIGSDTLVVCDGRALGKPKDEQDAERMLTCLSGRTHEVMTGLALYVPGKTACIDTVITKVCFAELDKSEIHAYIQTGEPMDKAGAYGIQGLGARFIAGISGDYYSVMGLPVRRLYEQMRENHLV
ncbi:MAG: Maf family protein [Butyricicoccus pullicaecorum]|nr:septum formation inhibitor Maf [Butyricicoccus pullicaecorum]MDO4669742.1 Maf family protein [Butyricicoccus pullicaecorum]